MIEHETTGRVTHPAEPGLPAQRGLAHVDDPWWATRTDAPYAVRPADEDVRRWAWAVG